MMAVRAVGQQTCTHPHCWPCSSSHCHPVGSGGGGVRPGGAVSSEVTPPLRRPISSHPKTFYSFFQIHWAPPPGCLPGSLQVEARLSLGVALFSALVTLCLLFLPQVSIPCSATHSILATWSLGLSPQCPAHTLVYTGARILGVCA